MAISESTAGPDPPHDHSFGQDQRRHGELRTLIVIGITVAMMIIEIAAGIAYGSMALLADGLHMGSHAAALGVAYFAYVFARRYAQDDRFSFGTGKVNALGGFVGAMLLAQFSLFMVWESIERLVVPTPITYNMAILVAVIGLMVNAASAVILGHGGHDHGGHDHDGHEHRGYDHAPLELSEATGSPHAAPGESRARASAATSTTHDHNLRSAYLHVLADAITSILAILALLGAKFWGWDWLDPVIGVFGAALIAKWSITLLRSTAAILLDREAPSKLRTALTDAIVDGSDDEIVDMHVWSIGPGVYAAEITIVSNRRETPNSYRSRIPAQLGVWHATIEVHAASRGAPNVDG